MSVLEREQLFDSLDFYYDDPYECFYDSYSDYSDDLYNSYEADFWTNLYKDIDAGDCGEDPNFTKNVRVKGRPHGAFSGFKAERWEFQHSLDRTLRTGVSKERLSWLCGKTNAPHSKKIQREKTNKRRTKRYSLKQEVREYDLE